MIEFLLFAGKFAFAVTLVTFLIFVILSKIKKDKASSLDERFYVRNLWRRRMEDKEMLIDERFDKKESKKIIDEFVTKSEESEDSRIYVIELNSESGEFNNTSFSRVVSSIQSIANENDSVLLKIESSGGSVSDYGLAAYDVRRLKEIGLKVVCVIDKVCASGGYMVAAECDKIIAAPMSLVGSIGVISQTYNISEVLEKVGIEEQSFASGDFKNSNSNTKKLSDKDSKHNQEKVDQIHKAFSDRIKTLRPNIKSGFNSGELWTGEQAVEQGLVDSIGSSEKIINDSNQQFSMVEVGVKKKQAITNRLGIAGLGAVTRLVDRFLSK